MRFSCESCQTRYTIADEKVRGRVLKVRCKTCGAAIMVREAGAQTVVDAPPSGDTPPPGVLVGEPSERPIEWFAMVNGKQEGPYLEAELLDRIGKSIIGRRTFLWNDRLPDWKRAEDIPALLPRLPPAAPSSPGPPTPGPGSLPIQAAVAAGADGDLSGGPKPHGEHTRMVMMHAGVDARGHRRRTLRIVSVAAALVLGAVALLLFLPASVLPPAPRAPGGRAPVPDASVWTAEGMESLRDRLLGRDHLAPSAPAATAATSVPPAGGAATQGAVIRREQRRAAPVPAATRNELAALYGDDAKKDAKVVKVAAATPHTDGSALDPSAVAKTIAENAASYKRCMDDYLRRNPSFRGGKIEIHATIAPSGIVTAASLSDRSVEGTDLGTCLKDRTKRIIFPKFSGDPFDVSYPLVLASGG